MQLLPLFSGITPITFGIIHLEKVFYFPQTWAVCHQYCLHLRQIFTHAGSDKKCIPALHSFSPLIKCNIQLPPVDKNLTWRLCCSYLLQWILSISQEKPWWSFHPVSFTIEGACWESFCPIVWPQADVTPFWVCFDLPGPMYSTGQSKVSLYLCPCILLSTYKT